MPDLLELIQRIEADGKITRDEIDMLHAKINEDGKVDNDEMMALQGIMSKLRMGDLKEV